MPRSVSIFYKGGTALPGSKGVFKKFSFAARLVFILALIFIHALSNGYAQSGFEYADSSILSGADGQEQTAVASTDFDSDTILYKHSVVISKDTLDHWKHERKFAYMKNIDSLLKAKAAEMVPAQQPPVSFLQKVLSSGFIQVLFWIIAIAVVGFVLYKLFLSKGNFIFKRSASTDAVKEINEEGQVAATADYDALIRQSYKLSDYRMAVRYLFLKTLRLLSDKQLLHYTADKTNFQYVQEIPTDKRAAFAAVVLNYEYVWYGNVPITVEQYTQIEKEFVSFNNKT